MKNPLVTIICTCYNHQDYIIEALDSIMEQTYTNIELIIVDDCSYDNSVSVINDWLLKHPNTTFISNSHNLGLTKSFNNAMKSSKGAYLMDLAADDLLNPNCIEKLINIYLTKNINNIGLVYSNAELINKSGKLISTYFNENMIEKIITALNINFYQYLLSDSAYMCSVTGLFKKEVFTQLKGYDEKLYFEDLDYWLRVSKKYNIGFSKDVLVKKRYLENSMGNGFFIKSEHTQKLHTSFYRILKKAYYLNSSTKEHLALTKRIYKQCRWAIKSLNLKYFSLYIVLLIKTYIKVLIS